MKNFILIMRILIIVFYFMSFNATAGEGWVSGGGELIQDAQNPWFIKNTKQVKYCLIIDEKNFGQQLEEVRPRIIKAFSFWKTQFTQSAYYFAYPEIRLGEQSFQEVKCDESPDIVFQFGTLTVEQIKKIENPNRHVGITVRTSYDRINLKGKGFVYISPQEGPLKVDLHSIKDKNWKPWTAAKGAYLLPVLIHEIGHIFGIPHDEDLFLMGQRSVERIFSLATNESTSKSTEEYWHNLNRSNQLNTYRIFYADGVPRDGYTCYEPKLPIIISQFFNLNNDEKCVFLDVIDKNFSLKVSTGGSKITRQVGTAKFKNKRIRSMRIVVKMWLTNEQVVLNLPVAGIQPTGVAMREDQVLFQGHFNFDDGKPGKQIFINGGMLNSLTIGGEYGGQIVPDLFGYEP